MIYHLAEACNNTFVLLDCLDYSINSCTFQKAHECLVKENKDDALILACGRQEQKSIFAQMFVLGMDGCLAEFCGNGARACAAHLYKRFPDVEKVYLCSSTRTHEAFRYQDDIYSISLPPVSFKPNPKFVTDIELLPEGFRYAEILEPHLIINRKLCDEELLLIGQQLNRKKELFPYGVNVNSWHVLEDNVLHVKTYERGVQRLTRSCGTGSTSCAAFYKKHGMVSVQTPGGILEIHLTNDHVKLKGPAHCWEKHNE